MATPDDKPDSMKPWRKRPRAIAIIEELPNSKMTEVLEMLEGILQVELACIRELSAPVPKSDSEGLRRWMRTNRNTRMFGGVK